MKDLKEKPDFMVAVLVFAGSDITTGYSSQPEIVFLISESIIWQKWTDSLEQTDLIVQSRYVWKIYVFKLVTLLLLVSFTPTLVHSEMHKSHILSCSQTVSVTCCFNSARNLSVIDIVYQPIKIFEWDVYFQQKHQLWPE